MAEEQKTEGMNKHIMWGGGKPAREAFIKKDHPTVNEIGEDFMPMLGAYINTGRKFKKDEATGGWVLQCILFERNIVRIYSRE